MAANILTSIGIILVPPIFLISFSCKTLKSLTCKSCCISPISSKNIVPVWANSNNPFFPPFFAPVKEPSSYPNSSLSSNSLGNEAQFIATKGLFFLFEWLCIDWVKASLPVPVSPVINIGLSVRAIFFAFLIQSFIIELLPIILLNLYLAT